MLDFIELSSLMKNGEMKKNVMSNLSLLNIYQILFRRYFSEFGSPLVG